MNINVWNGHVFSYFSVGGKTVYQIRVEGPNVLVEFQFDTDRYLFDDFDTGKSTISKNLSPKYFVCDICHPHRGTPHRQNWFLIL